MYTKIKNEAKGRWESNKCFFFYNQWYNESNEKQNKSNEGEQSEYL